MGQLADAVKSAASVIFGTAPWGTGQVAGTRASDPFSTIFDAGIAHSIVDNLDAGDLYATQPHLRTVVSFVARNGAQLGRHIYKEGASGRERVKQSVAASTLAKPNDYMTGYDLFNMLFSELAIYDMALWVPVYRDSRWQIDPIPGEWVVGIKKASAFQTSGYRVRYPDKTEDTFLPAAQVVAFRGYSPHGFQRGSSAVRALRGVLGEQVAAMDFRQQMWRRGGRVGMYMTRPKDAPNWSDEAQKKFTQTWRNNWSGDGANAGSTPLLEDGMELKRVGFNAKEEQWLEAATLSLSTVAGAFHVPPAMVGVSGYNSFASVKEFRKMLYTETLGPGIAQIEDTVNHFLLPFIGEPEANYFELNIGEKLQGDFEEQAAVLQAAVGGPYMTVNEARRKNNLPDIDGGDELLAPLNMGAAGNNGPAASEPIVQGPSGASETPSPDDTPPKAQNLSHTNRANGLDAYIKEPTEPDYGITSDMSRDIKKVLRRQQAAVKSALAAKADAWWDTKKWDKELSDTLHPHMLALSAGVAREAAEAKSLNPDDYSVGRTTNFLKSVADSRASRINVGTHDRVAEAITSGDVEASIDQVFADEIETHAPLAALTLTTMLAAWAMTEMARQLVPDKRPQKTWVSSGLQNSRHEDLNGETVPIDQPFSNGAQWPGDPVLGAEGAANCGCAVEISFDL